MLSVLGLIEDATPSVCCEGLFWGLFGAAEQDSYTLNTWTRKSTWRFMGSYK